CQAFRAILLARMFGMDWVLHNLLPRTISHEQPPLTRKDRAHPLVESGRGQPHSKTWRIAKRPRIARSVLECGCPLPLFLVAIRAARPFRSITGASGYCHRSARKPNKERTASRPRLAAAPNVKM